MDNSSAFNSGVNAQQPWKQKVIMISGGLGDIGMAIALSFGKRGARIALCDIDPQTLSKDASGDENTRMANVKSLKAAGIEVLYHQVDVTDPAAIDQWLVEVVDTWGSIEVAVMNAASIAQSPLAGMDASSWKRQLDINLNGSFYLASAAASYMKMHTIKGNLVFLGSWAAHAVHLAIPAYSVAKAGVRMLMQCMALELAPFGIRVNEIAPGYVQAGLSKKVWQDNPALAAQAASRVPMGTLIDPKEVAENICWLCARENSNLTGNSFLLDGGLSLVRP